MISSNLIKSVSPFLFSVLFTTSVLSAEMASVKIDKVSLRQEPDGKSKVLWELNSGFPVEIVKRKGDWVFVKDFENDSGWIHRSGINRKSHVIVKANKNEEQSINIRKTPSMSSTVIGNAFYGVVFSVLESKNGWVQVQHETGFSGWIKGDLLWGI